MSKSIVELRDGRKIPLLAIGTAHGSPREVGILVDFALTMGLRHLDVTCVQEVEVVVGQVLTNWLLSGRIRRQDVFVCAKLPPHAMKPSRVKRFLLKSLLNLGLNYVDVFIVASPVAWKETTNGQQAFDIKASMNDIWAAMEDAEDEGLTKSLGIANFNLQQMQKLRDSSKIKPQMIQIEYHPFLQEKNLIDYCKTNKIQVTAIVPPVFTDHQTVDPINPLYENPTLKSMTKPGRNVEQVLFKWLQQKKMVILCENLSIYHITKCLQIFDFELNPEQAKTIDRLDNGHRYYVPPCLEGCQGQPDYPFK